MRDLEMDKLEKENCFKLRHYIEMSKAKNAEIQQDLYNNATNKLDNEIYNHQKNVQSLKIDTSPVFKVSLNIPIFLKNINSYEKKSSQHNILRSSEGKACKSLKFLPQEKSHLFSPIKYQKADNNPIPKLNWADNHNLWKLLKESENRLESKANLLNNHPDLNNHMLQVLFDWLSEVCGVMNLKRVTYHLTLHLVNTYIYREFNIKRNILQLIGITSLFIAAKIQEIYPPRLKMLAYFTDHACLQEDILLQELYSLQVLNWEINIMTCIDWLGLYFQILSHKIFLKQQPNNEKLFENIKSCSTYSYIQIAQIIDLCTVDIKSLSYKYSLIAATAISFFIPNHFIKDVTGYEYEDLQFCMKWLYGYVDVIIKSNQYVSTIATIDFIPELEKPHIHIHTIKLDLLHQAQLINSKNTSESKFIEETFCTSETPLKNIENSMSINNLLTPPMSSKKIKYEK